MLIFFIFKQTERPNFAALSLFTRFTTTRWCAATCEEVRRVKPDSPPPLRPSSSLSFIWSTAMSSSSRRSSAAVAAAVILAVVVLLADQATVVAAGKLPASFKRCSVSDAKLDECLQDAVQDAFLKMKDGISTLGLLPVDPLKVDEIKIDQGQGSSVSLNMDLKNITIYGLGDAKLSNFRSNIAEGILETDTYNPLLRLDFMHTTSGRVMVLPIRGEGPGTITLTDLTTHHYLKFVPKTKKDGKKYWSIQDYNIKLKPRSTSMDLKGLFGADDRLSDQLNGFLNQNSKLIFDEIGGSFEDAFGAVFKEFTHRLFNKVPIDDIIMPAKEA